MTTEAPTDFTRLAAAVTARLDATYTLTYVSQGDKLSDEQVDFIVSGDMESLYSSTEEWESDSNYSYCKEIIAELVTDVVRDWEREDPDADFGDLADEFENTSEWDEIRFEIQDRDDSNIYQDLARGTSDVLLRITAIDEDDAGQFSFREGVDPRDILAITGIPCTTANIKTITNALAEVEPEFHVMMGYWVIGADVGSLLDMRFDTTSVLIRDPYLYLGNPFTGSGWITDQLHGLIKVAREDMHTDKAAFGYSVNDIYGGLYGSQFSATITPVPAS